jgi:hypothetical protein
MLRIQLAADDYAMFGRHLRDPGRSPQAAAASEKYIALACLRYNSMLTSSPKHPFIDFEAIMPCWTLVPNEPDDDVIHAYLAADWPSVFSAPPLPANHGAREPVEHGGGESLARQRYRMILQAAPRLDIRCLFSPSDESPSVTLMTQALQNMHDRLARQRTMPQGVVWDKPPIFVREAEC